LAAKIGRYTCSGFAMACSARAMISRERGPGISVRMSIVLVAATGRSVPEHEAGGLRLADVDDLDPDPHVQFDAWLAEASAAGVRTPEQTALATATLAAVPSR